MVKNLLYGALRSKSVEEKIIVQKDGDSYMIDQVELEIYLRGNTIHKEIIDDKIDMKGWQWWNNSCKGHS